MHDHDSNQTEGIRLGDLTRDGGLDVVVGPELRALGAERDAYREVAIEKEQALQDIARRDVESEARRRSGGRGGLRAV